jgi:hypothetical protein
MTTDMMGIRAEDYSKIFGSPVIHFRRTATEDTDVNGFPIKAGERAYLHSNFINGIKRLDCAWD